MTEQTKDPELKGVTDGVNKEDLNAGETRGEGAPQAPVITNTPPAEEKKADEQKPADEAKPEEKTDEQKAEDKKAEDEAKKADEAEVTAYAEDYGDDSVNAVVATLKDSGVDVKEADGWFREAAETGDLSKIKVTEIAAKLGKEKAALVVTAVKDYYTRTQGSVKETVNAAYEQVGGEENWKKVSAWAAAQRKADPAFNKKADELNAMFELSPTAAAIAAKELRSLYEAASGNSSLQVKQVQGQAAASVGVNLEPISRKEYAEQYEAAHKRGDTTAMATLNARRQATIKSK